MKLNRWLGVSFALAISTLSTSAKHINPQEALQRALGSQLMLKAPSISAPELIHTIPAPNSLAEAYYVFANPSHQGFMILAADDQMVPIIGYSDSGSFGTGQMPPALKYWLDQYATAILSNQAVTDMPLSRTDGNELAPITPIVKTKWNQSSPYNQQCPLFRNRHAITGCVATGMAQIMKVHEYPASGTGFRKYTYDDNGKECVDSVDFANTIFDWANMTDTYNASSTAEQEDAVATLMHACGVAAEMQYGLEESSAMETNAGKGLIRYLNYDKAMRWVNRNWFENDQWRDLLYDQLAKGLPVMMGGTDAYDHGHEFICDGYSADDFFHFNWGWGGLADGYYYLYKLEPTGLGLGAGSGSYDLNQSALIDIKPAVADSEYTPALYTENFMTEYSAYTRGNMYVITFIGGTLSASLYPVEYTFGLQLTDEKGNHKYIEAFQLTLDTNRGINRYEINTMDFPIGKWRVSPAYKTATTDWQTTYYNHSTTTNTLYLEVTKNEIQVGVSNVRLSANNFTWKPLDETDTEFKAAHTYEMSFDVTASEKWDGDIYCFIFADGKIEGTATPKNVSLETAKAQNETWTVTFDKSLITGTYNLALATRSGLTYNIFYQTPIDIVGNKKPGTAKFAWDQADDTSIAYHPGFAYDFNFTITTTGVWSGAKRCILMYNDSGYWYYLCKGALIDLNFEDAGTYQKTWSVALPKETKPGQYYVALANDDNTFSTSDMWPLTVTATSESPTLSALYIGWLPEDPEDKAIYPGHTYDFEYILTSNGYWYNYVYCYISGEDAMVSERTSFVVSLDGTEPMDTFAKLTLNPEIEAGTYTLNLVTYKDGEPISIDAQTITITEYDGISSIINDDTKAVYYNLQGMPVKNPTKGNIYILRQGVHTSKVIY